MKNRKLWIGLIGILIIIMLMPFWPYKIYSFNSSGYDKVKVRYSSLYGLRFLDEYSELGVEKNEEFEQGVTKYLEEFKEINSEIDVVDYPASGVGLTLYGEFVEDEDGNSKFYIEEWRASYLPIYYTYLWDGIMASVYHVIILPDIIIIIIVIYKKLLR